MAPAISVVMPAFNAMPYLPRAIESMLLQDFPGFELIIVDDGSDDETPDVAHAYAQSDPRVRLLRVDHVGVTRALNCGLAAARGDLVARMDADDLSHPERLRRQCEMLRWQPDLVAVGCWVMRIDEDGDPLGVKRWPTEHEDIDRGLLRGSGGLPHPGAMMRRAPVVELGGYREEFRYAQDKDLWLRLAERGRLANLNVPLLYYREHLKSIGAQCRLEQQQSVARAVEDAHRRRGLPPSHLPLRIRQSNPVTIHRLRRRWVRVAIQSANHATARKHALRLFRERPWDVTAWWAMANHLLACPRRPENRDSVPDTAIPQPAPYVPAIQAVVRGATIANPARRARCPSLSNASMSKVDRLRD